MHRGPHEVRSVSHPSRVPRVCFARPFTPEKCKTNYYCSTIFYIFSFIIMTNCGIFFNLCSFTVSYQRILYSHLLHHKFVGNLRPSMPAFTFCQTLGTLSIYSGTLFFYNITLNQRFCRQFCSIYQYFCKGYILYNLKLLKNVE